MQSSPWFFVLYYIINIFNKKCQLSLYSTIYLLCAKTKLKHFRSHGKFLHQLNKVKRYIGSQKSPTRKKKEKKKKETKSKTHLDIIETCLFEDVLDHIVFVGTTNARQEFILNNQM